MLLAIFLFALKVKRAIHFLGLWRRATRSDLLFRSLQKTTKRNSLFCSLPKKVIWAIFVNLLNIFLSGWLIPLVGSFKPFFYLWLKTLAYDWTGYLIPYSLNQFSERCPKFLYDLPRLFLVVNNILQFTDLFRIRLIGQFGNISIMAHGWCLTLQQHSGVINKCTTINRYCWPATYD